MSAGGPITILREPGSKARSEAFQDRFEMAILPHFINCNSGDSQVLKFAYGLNLIFLEQRCALYPEGRLEWCSSRRASDGCPIAYKCPHKRMHAHASSQAPRKSARASCTALTCAQLYTHARTAPTQTSTHAHAPSALHWS